MRLSVALSNDEADIDPGPIVEQATLAEELGYSGVWLPDHPLAPEPYGDVYGGVYEPLMLLAHIAAVTTRVTLGTSVIIAPLREPVTLAKQVATLERLAPGRVVLGVGIGWESREFDALGVPFTERGARTDELLDLVRALHAGETPGAGRFHGSPTGVFAPRPTAPVEILVGGSSTPALRRAARIADRWLGFGFSPEEFRTYREQLDELSAPRRPAAGLMLSRAEGRRPIDELVDRLRRLDEAGCDEVVIHFGPSAATSDPMTDLMRRWAGQAVS